MARWKLRNPHYLNVPGTEYDYKETSELTGKSKRVIFEVPILLNTNDQSDFNYPELGAIIVAHGDGKHEPRDIIFVGPPTPEMEALDDEAEAISASLAASWIPPVDSLPATGNGSLSDEAKLMMKEFAGMIGEKLSGNNQSVAAVSMEEFNALKAQMAEMAAALAGQAKVPDASAASSKTRRI